MRWGMDEDFNHTSSISGSHRRTPRASRSPALVETRLGFTDAALTGQWEKQGVVAGALPTKLSPLSFVLSPLTYLGRGDSALTRTGSGDNCRFL